MEIDEKMLTEEKETIFLDKLILEQQKMFEENIEKFDIDKVLLVCAYRSKDILEKNKFEESQEIFIDIMRVAAECIENPRAKIVGNLYQGNDCTEYIEYSAKKLKEDLSKIIGDEYYSNERLTQTRKEYLDGTRQLGEIKTEALFKLYNFSTKEKMQLININPINFENMILFDQLQKAEVKTALDSIEGLKLSASIVAILYNDECVDRKDIINLYMKHNINLQQMLDLNNALDLKPELTVKELMNYYSDMKKDGEKQKDFDRYSLLFREINIKGQSEEEQNKSADEIVEEIYKLDSDYSVDFKEMYKSDLLPIKTLVEWNGEEIIYDLIRSNELKSRDAKELLISGQLNTEKVYFVLKNSKASETQKMNFIYSSFDGVGQNEEEEKMQNDARNYLIQVLNISKKSSDFTGEREQSGTRKKVEEKVKRNQYITDPVHRWALFSALDEQCSTESFVDGTVIFTLPNVKGGTVVIEKMLKNTKYGNKSDYGVATYIMSQEEFFNNKSDIIQDKGINRKALIDLHGQNKADKLTHVLSWGNGLKKNLGISQESGYTQEKIEKIDNLIDRIEKARELID